MSTTLTSQQAHRTYDVLVELGGAQERGRQEFVFHQTRGCAEYRFGGYLGFGGKYYSDANRVSCYREDDTPELLELIKQINQRLAAAKT